MFIRIKKIKGIPYAYKVKNRWTKQGVKQKNVGYLGKVYCPKIKKKTSFRVYIEKRGTDFEEYLGEEYDIIVKDIIVWELLRHGFEKKSADLTYEDVSLSTKKRYFFQKRKYAIKMKDGYFSNESVRTIMNPKKYDDEKAGEMLAKAFVDAGIEIPKDVFVALYRKLYGE